MIDTIVFTGPSLSPEEAKAILPNACYHKPIACGDIIKCMRLMPKRIVIIDGYFGHTGSVWHKEILFALSSGVEVYGASSMGALRAAELKDHGMIGMGKIYQQFASGELIDDDEVTLVHQDDFNHRITPMCNIRATLELALIAGIASEKTIQNITASLKALPYFERAFLEYIPDEKLRMWCQSNMVDQKKADAKSLLFYLAQTPTKKATCSSIFVPTLFFHKIYREMICTPFTDQYPWLTEHERLYCDEAKQKSGLSFIRYAKLLHIQHNLRLPTHTYHNSKHHKWVKYLSILDKTKDNKSKRILKLCAPIIQNIADRMYSKDIKINTNIVQSFANNFRTSNNLNSPANTLEWIHENGLKDQAGFIEFINHACFVHTLIDDHNAHLITADLDFKNNDWLRRATVKIMTEQALPLQTSEQQAKTI